MPPRRKQHSAIKLNNKNNLTFTRLVLLDSLADGCLCLLRTGCLLRTSCRLLRWRSDFAFDFGRFAASLTADRLARLFGRLYRLHHFFMLGCLQRVQRVLILVVEQTIPKINNFLLTHHDVAHIFKAKKLLPIGHSNPIGQIHVLKVKTQAILKKNVTTELVNVLASTQRQSIAFHSQRQTREWDKGKNDK